MSELDNCDKKNKSFCRHFILPKNEELSVIALYSTAMVDAVFQILLIIALTIFWILSIYAVLSGSGFVVVFVLMSGFALMVETFCCLQLILSFYSWPMHVQRRNSSMWKAASCGSYFTCSSSSS